MLSSIVMHGNCRELDVVINEIIWEDQTAVFLLLPVLTFKAYNYTVEPPESYHPKCQDPVFSRKVHQSLTRIEMRPLHLLFGR